MKKPEARKLGRLFKFGIGLSAIIPLTGCLISSPFWGQEYNSHTTSIPIQGWTRYQSSTVVLECSKAFHGGLYPYPSGQWHHVDNLTPQTPGVLDPLGSRVYSVGTKMVLPDQCWRSETTTAGIRYRAAVRLKQVQPKLFGSGTYTEEFKTVDKPGLECVGRWNGYAASWFGYLNKSCTKTYSGSTNQIPYVIFSAKS